MIISFAIVPIGIKTKWEFDFIVGDGSLEGPKQIAAFPSLCLLGSPPLQGNQPHLLRFCVSSRSKIGHFTSMLPFCIQRGNEFPSFELIQGIENNFILLPLSWLCPQV